MDKKTFSAPGRIEICGNHTDHQRGMVMAAAINLEATCIAAPNGTGAIHISSDGFAPADIDLRDLNARDDEKGAMEALVRGVAHWFKKRGYAIGGFDAEIKSDIPAGMGLSSSAAFEVLIGNVFKGLFGSDAPPLDIALAGQYAENVYFGKPCGLMDQVASSFGGLMTIDFFDPVIPVVTRVAAGFGHYAPCVVATGGSHADLTGDYAAIPAEMGAVAAHFGKTSLRDVHEEEFYSAIGGLRHLGDRAILRAMHFFKENERVKRQAAALMRGDLPEFMALVIESGRSSMELLQNIYSPNAPQQQGLTLGLALSESVLRGRGAWRVHGGGFAGTILAFVPEDLKNEYETRMDAVFGIGSCHFLSIRDTGGAMSPSY